jgi:hypothetical protein
MTIEKTRCIVMERQASDGEVPTTMTSEGSNQFPEES